jgi:hypothetical protein
MTVPKKPTGSADALESFIAGAGVAVVQTISVAQQTQEAAGAAPPAKPRKRPIRQKDEVLRQTFVVGKSVVDKLEAFAFWNRKTKRFVLEAALEQFFADKKITPIPRQDME